MSEPLTLETQQLEPIENSSTNVLVQDIPLEENSHPIEDNTQEITINNGSKAKQTPPEDLKVSSSTKKCSSHPEEDLQFYCFDNGAILCAECLLKGEYAGSNVSSLRKAAETIKGKLSSLVSEMNNKLDACSSVQNETNDYQSQIEDTIQSYKEQVTKKMNELREAINVKEQELLDKVNTMKEDRLQAFVSAGSSVQDYKDDVQGVKDIIENNIQDSNDLIVCQFYSERVGRIKGQLSNEVGSKIRRAKRIVDRCQLQDQGSFNKFNEITQKIILQIEALGSEIGRHRFETLSSCVETNEEGTKGNPSSTKSKKNAPTFAERVEIHQKEPVFISNVAQLYPNPEQTSFLAKTHYGESLINSTLTSPLNNKSTFMVNMYRENFNRPENNNNLSIRGPSSILESYKGQLAKANGARVNTAGNLSGKKEVSLNLTQPKTTIASKFSSSKLVDSVFSPKTSRFSTVKQYTNLESSIDQIEKIMTARVGTEKGLTNYSKNSLPQREVNFNFERKYTDSKFQKPVESFAFKSQDSLRQKLTSLNSKLFN